MDLTIEYIEKEQQETKTPKDGSLFYRGRISILVWKTKQQQKKKLHLKLSILFTYTVKLDKQIGGQNIVR